MLVLSRKEGQVIYVEDVKIVIQKVRNGRVSIGIEADKCVRILRGEVADRDANKLEEVPA